MALPILPNSSNFLGVALVINRTRDGPRFVFHYPPHIVPAENRQRQEDANDEQGADEDDILLERSTNANNRGPTLNPSELLAWDQDDHLVTDSGSQIVPWEHVAGFPTKDLESILTPARAYHKTLFQISLDPLYFVSYPVHAPVSGIWKKKKKSKVDRPKSNGASKENDEVPTEEADGPSAHESETQVASEAEHIEVRDMAKTATAKPATEEGDMEKASSMTMFNLVFILNPKKHESRDLIDTMYSNIVRKVNKAYKYVQQRSDFVWKESKKILALKDKAREDKRKLGLLWEEILQSSSLAASMLDLYEAVSQNKIAALQLDTIQGAITHSVQIPFPFHIADISPLDREDDNARGLWITTANSFVNDSDAFDEPGYLDKNFALLLMDDEKKIISELSADPDETTLSMIEFVRHSKPTMSFHQVGQQSSNVLSLGQVRKFAQHFIFWRRAIAIPPLHARDVYVLSPNADLRKLPYASGSWARQFPFAPALPNFLADLSAAPRPYKWFCPSKSFRPNYLQMLAWLMRGGWVTQLCTFAYVVVWPEILYEIEYALEADEVAKAKRAQIAAIGDLEHGSPEKSGSSSILAGRFRGGGDLSSSFDNLASSTSTLQPSIAGASSHAHNMSASVGDLSSFSISQPADDAGDDQRSVASSSQFSSPSTSYKDAPPSSSGDPLSPSSHHPAPTLAEQVAEKARLERIADKAARELAEKATAHARKAQPKATDHPGVNNAAHLGHLSPYIILDAKKATGKESLYLSAIATRLRARKSRGPPAGGGGKGGVGGAGGSSSKENKVDWDERVATTWPVFWKYFNGRSALERIALQEEMKRKDVWNLLTAMSEYLITTRHW